MKIPNLICLLAGLSLGCIDLSHAATFLPYPQGEITADELAEQAYAVSHNKFVKTFSSKRHKKYIARIVNRTSLKKRTHSRKPTVNKFEVYIKNTLEDPVTESLQMAFIESGKIKGMGILYKSFKDETKTGTLSFWLPALHKIRQITEPAHDDNWIGSNLTYGELILREPKHEIHQIEGKKIMDDCLQSMKLSPKENNRFTHGLPGQQCAHKGKEVFILKSTTKFKSWWYDYRITEIDSKTFAPYRTVYFKNDKKIKTVDIDWQPLGLEDPRILYPRYIYAITHATGVDSLVYIPKITISINEDRLNSFWSINTLKQHGR